MIGADIVEFNPRMDPLNITAAVCAKLLKEIAAKMLAPAWLNEAAAQTNVTRMTSLRKAGKSTKPATNSCLQISACKPLDNASIEE